MKVTMYGAGICPDCVVAKKQLTGNQEVELIYKDITSSTAILKEFLAYRDHEECFDTVKEDGKIGIPFFLLEDGTKTFEIADYVEVDQTIERTGAACSIDGKHC